MGADIVKVPYTGSPGTFREVVEGCASPVVIAGGEKMGSDEEVFRMVKGAMEAGGAGASIGRNVFQHRSPAAMVRAIAAIVHGGASVREAAGILKREET
jgi:class I fructose-bisphosphate aldolase